MDPRGCWADSQAKGSSLRKPWQTSSMDFSRLSHCPQHPAFHAQCSIEKSSTTEARGTNLPPKVLSSPTSKDVKPKCVTLK
eukprot:4378240-Amphidinium_carterae.1